MDFSLTSTEAEVFLLKQSLADGLVGVHGFFIHRLGHSLRLRSSVCVPV